MVGDILRAEREKQNISIKDVESETSIRALYISSIEEGKYDVIPGEVYLRGFIKTYANFLQLDANKILQQYKAEKAPQESAAEASASADSQNIQQSAPAEPLVSSSVFEKPTLREKMAEKRQRSSLYGKAAMGILGIIVIGLLGYFAFGSSADNETAATKPVPQQTAATQSSAKATDKASDKQKPAADKFVTYQAKYNDDCWSKVEADGKIILEETIKKGAVVNWQAEKTLVITAGNAGAVEMTANGKSLGALGKPGEVVTKKFTGEKIAP